MKVYAESSAVLAWLLNETDGERVRRVLADADSVSASELTLVECDRALRRGVHLGELNEAVASERTDDLTRAASRWLLIPVSDEVLSRARRPFAVEPVRTLDAIHVSSALLARSNALDVALLALDARVRRNGEALGFEVLP